MRRATDARWVPWLAIVIVLWGAACSRGDGSAPVSVANQPSPAAVGFTWDLGTSQALTWQGDDGRFSQAHAIEASGLASSGRHLWVTLEKYAAVLQIDLQDLRARTIPVAVPPHSELEGATYAGGRLYLCDEAHATVYQVAVDVDDVTAEGDPGYQPPVPLPVSELVLQGIDVKGGKLGFEGIAVEPDNSCLYLAFEQRQEGQGCAAVIYRMAFGDGVLYPQAEPLVIPLAGCDWRLTCLLLHEGRLLTLRTRYPRKHYDLLDIDPVSGAWRELADLTDLARNLSDDGWADNLEGLAVSDAGDLYVVSDNAMTGIIDDPAPPLAAETTLLLRLPRARRPLG